MLGTLSSDVKNEDIETVPCMKEEDVIELAWKGFVPDERQRKLEQIFSKKFNKGAK